jgi:ABC-2 type transport system permease protein
MLLAVATLWKRELVRFLRQRSRVFGTLATPLIFWLLLGSGIGSSFSLPGTLQQMDYLEYFYPGTILLIILFTTIFSSLSIIEDRKEGFLLSVLVAPVSRSAIVLGKILGGATVAFIQGFLLLLLAPLVDISLDFWKIVTVSGALMLASLSLSGLGFAAAWKTESMEGYHTVMNAILFPMWLLSGALFPAAGAFSWVRWVMIVNPATYVLALLRHLLYDPQTAASMDLPALWLSIVVTILFGMAVFLVSFQMVRHSRVRGME